MDFIFDRTESDVSQAKKLRANKVANGIELTDDEKELMERGFMTLTTLNRIEQGLVYAQNTLRESGYYVPKTDLVKWEFYAGNFSTGYSADKVIFKFSNFQAMLDKLKVIRDNFQFPDDTPQVPEQSYHWKTLNDIEQILHDVGVAKAELEANYRECGAYYCGEDDYIG